MIQYNDCRCMGYLSQIDIFIVFKQCNYKNVRNFLFGCKSKLKAFINVFIKSGYLEY